MKNIIIDIDELAEKKGGLSKKLQSVLINENSTTKRKDGVLMKREKIKMTAEDIIRHEKAAENMGCMQDLLDSTTKILDAVKVDRDYLEKMFRKILEKETGINKFFNLFGFKLVKNDISLRDNAENGLDYMLMLDQEEFKAVIEEMAKALADNEKVKREKQDIIEEKIKEFENIEKEKGEIKNKSKRQLEIVARWIQDKLGKFKGEENDDLISKQLNDLMDRLKIKAYWSAEGTSFHEAEMFEILNAEGNYKDFPCLIYNGEVLLQGVKICKIDASAKSEISNE